MVKNYKILCETLGIPTKGGDSKKSQLKELGRFCRLKQIGTKFIVMEVYETPTEKIDLRSNGNRSIYVRYIEGLLLNYFINEQRMRCSFTKNQLWRILGMVNDNYRLLYEKPLSDDQLMKIEEHMKQHDLNDFYFRTRNKLYEILRNALYSLNSRGLIVLKEETVGCIVRDDGTRNYIPVRSLAHNIKLQEIKFQSLDEVGLESDRDLFKAGPKVRNQYQTIRNGHLKEELGWDYTFTRYSITCVEKYIRRGLQKVERGLLNSEVIKAVDTNADKMFQKNMQDYKDGKTTYWYSPYYPVIQRVLSQKLLNLNAESLNYLFSIDIKAEIDAVFDID